MRQRECEMDGWLEGWSAEKRVERTVTTQRNFRKIEHMITFSEIQWKQMRLNTPPQTIAHSNDGEPRNIRPPNADMWCWATKNDYTEKRHPRHKLKNCQQRPCGMIFLWWTIENAVKCWPRRANRSAARVDETSDAQQKPEQMRSSKGSGPVKTRRNVLSEVNLVIPFLIQLPQQNLNRSVQSWPWNVLKH